MTVVVDLDRRVDPRKEDRLPGLRPAPYHQGDVLLRLSHRPDDVELFIAADTERLNGIIALDWRGECPCRRLERWMRSKLLAITARTPRSGSLWPASPLNDRCVFLTPNTIIGVPCARYRSAASKIDIVSRMMVERDASLHGEPSAFGGIMRFFMRTLARCPVHDIVIAPPVP